MITFRVVLSGAMLLLLVVTAQAGRFYGTGTVSWQHVEESGDRLIVIPREDTVAYDEVVVPLNTSEDLSSETMLLNYEDIVWYKNRLRLSAYLIRRELGSTNDREFRPTYSAELRSYGYSLTTSYAPYTQRAATQTALGLEPSNIVHREWRNTLSLSYPRVPTLSIVYNKNESHDQERTGRIDGSTRNFLAETNHSLGDVSARVNYSNLRQVRRMSFPFTNVQRSYTGTLSSNRQLGRIAFFSGTYTYYDTRNSRVSGGVENITRSHNHSVAAVLGAHEWRHLAVSASFSGRFAESRFEPKVFESQNQAIAGQLSYRPLGYLSFDVTKTYQYNRDQSTRDINENLSLATTLSRSLRRGIDTRFTMSRIWVQQALQVTASGGEKYELDTYRASFGFEPYGFVRTMVDASLVHNSEPFQPEQRYQMNTSLNARLMFTRTFEGRVSVTALYQGAQFRFGHSYAQNFNIGASYAPQSNLTFNVNYLHAVANATVRSESGTWIGYAGYSFRRAFSLSVSANVQEQDALTSRPDGSLGVITLLPYEVGGQLLINLSARTKLTTAYVYKENPTVKGLKTIIRELKMILNVQL